MGFQESREPLSILSLDSCIEDPFAERVLF
jgi:hypothetical protein